MDWIKKHADQFSLALLALVLLALSVMVFLKTQSFAEGFSDAQKSPPHSKELPPVVSKPIEEAEKKLTSPTVWKGGALFVSNPLLVTPAGTLEYATKGKTHRDVPNTWLLKYNLNILSPTILDEDTDRDGFSNYDEYLGADRSAANGEADSTDPTGKDSHPPYYTKLFLNRQHLIPFRLLFNAYDADPKTVPAEKINFQINTLDLRQPTEFLLLGNMVPNTKYKLVKFEYKTQKNESTQVDDDVSELILEHVETKEQITLVYQKTINSPTYFAIFHYLWPDAQKPKEFAVKKGDPFTLEPNAQEKYKLEDVTKTEAIIQLPSGGKYTAPLVAKATPEPAAPAAPADAAAPATPPAAQPAAPAAPPAATPPAGQVAPPPLPKP